MTPALVQELIGAPTAPGASLPELPELLRMFNEVSGRLSETHRRLEERVGGLQRELADAQEGLRRSRALAALGEMAAGIAHEVRNPLASIALHAEILREALADQPAQCELLDKIARAITRLDGIVGDVLRFARNGRGEPRTVRVRESIEEALSACRAEIADAKVEVECRGRASLAAHVDPASLVQALVNLLRNAVEAMRESAACERRLVVEATERDRLGADGRRASTIVIAVEDTGPGFDPAIVDRVFTPFVTTRASGTGLGLAIVHRIADASGGAVWIGRAPRGGARVEFMIPATAPATEPGGSSGWAGDGPRSEPWDA